MFQLKQMLKKSPAITGLFLVALSVFPKSAYSEDSYIASRASVESDSSLLRKSEPSYKAFLKAVSERFDVNRLSVKEFSEKFSDTNLRRLEATSRFQAEVWVNGIPGGDFKRGGQLFLETLHGKLPSRELRKKMLAPPIFNPKHYKLERKIETGRGGGQVFFVEQQDRVGDKYVPNGKKFVLKVLPKVNGKKGRVVRGAANSTIRELHITNFLSSTGASFFPQVSWIGFSSWEPWTGGGESDHVAILMEQLQGRPMRDIDPLDDLSPLDLASLAVQAAVALKFLKHHGDVHFGNFFVLNERYKDDILAFVPVTKPGTGEIKYEPKVIAVKGTPKLKLIDFGQSAVYHFDGVHSKFKTRKFTKVHAEYVIEHAGLKALIKRIAGSKDMSSDLVILLSQLEAARKKQGIKGAELNCKSLDELLWQASRELDLMAKKEMFFFDQKGPSNRRQTAPF